MSCQMQDENSGGEEGMTIASCVNSKKRNSVGQVQYACGSFIFMKQLSIDDIFTYQNVNWAFYKCFKANSKKTSNRNYYDGMLFKNLDLMDEVREGVYEPSQTTDFWITERGKKRYISAPVMRDRIVQKIICQKVFVPQLTSCFIYDSYSSVIGRGTTMARKRFENMLYSFLREIDYKYQDTGYLLQVDIRKFFDNIDHGILKSMLDRDLKVGDDLKRLIFRLIDSSSDSDIGLNIGSELPQILAMYYLSKMDNYIKCVRSVKRYGRYADDIFIFGTEKTELQRYLKDIKSQLADLKLEVNEKKTHIVALRHGFTYLQTVYKIVRVDGDYKVLKMPTRTKIVRERKRLKEQKRKHDKGLLQFKDIYFWYRSFIFSLKAEYNAVDQTIASLDELFSNLFEGCELPERETRESISWR